MLDQKVFGEKLRNHRKKLGMTQEEVAAHIGISYQAISKWERGDGYPDITMLPTLANYFGVSVDELIGMDEISSAQKLDDINRKWQENRLHEDHQTKNAMALVNKNAAIHIADVKAKEELLPTAVSVITDNDRLQSLSENIQGMAKPNAAQQIADEVLMLADAFIEKETRRKKENLK